VQVSVPVVENQSGGYPESIQLFRVEIRAFESLDSRLSASTHCRPGFVQGSVPGGKSSSGRHSTLAHFPYLEHFVISPIKLRYSNRRYGWMITIFS